MTKIVSPCEIALFGHSGSQAPQLMQSLVIIVAIDSILLTFGGIGTNKTRIILDEFTGGCKSAARFDVAVPKHFNRVLSSTGQGYTASTSSHAVCKGSSFYPLLLAWRRMWVI